MKGCCSDLSLKVRTPSVAAYQPELKLGVYQPELKFQPELKVGCVSTGVEGFFDIYTL